MPATSANIKAKKRKREKDELAAELSVALAWMDSTGRGVKAALNQFPEAKFLTQGKVQGAVDRRKKAAAAAAAGNVSADAHSGARLLTELEEEELVDWMIQKNKALAGAYDDDVERQIVKILKARQLVRQAWLSWWK
jgi:hypothetical protein